MLQHHIFRFDAVPPRFVAGPARKAAQMRPKTRRRIFRFPTTILFGSFIEFQRTESESAMPQDILPPLTGTAPSAPDSPGEEPFVADPDDLPPELAFDPVPQQTKRWAGIIPHKQRLFVAHLAATGSVTMAAKASALYQLRKREGAAGFSPPREPRGRNVARGSFGIDKREPYCPRQPLQPYPSPHDS
ncbi:hypothetical protein [Sphingopyxis indica]|nr:hypothetical protein [Sphingopyxis indica]